MPDVVLNDLCLNTIELLEGKAKYHNRSLRSYLRMIVENAANQKDINRDELMSRHLD